MNYIKIDEIYNLNLPRVENIDSHHPLNFPPPPDDVIFK